MCSSRPGSSLLAHHPYPASALGVVASPPPVASPKPQTQVHVQEHTNYHFEVEPSNLQPALERFAGFFVSPMCKADALDRELQVGRSCSCPCLPS